MALFVASHFDKKQLERIRPLLTSPQPAVRELAAYILVQIEGKAALPSILPLLDDLSTPRTYAALILARFATQEHAELALRTARDPKPEVRQYGLAALARIKNPDSFRELRRALHDQIDAVRQAAATCLARTLTLEKNHTATFIQAFKTGKLERELLESAVTRAELHPLVEKAAAEYLPEAETAEPKEKEPPAEQPDQPGFKNLAATQASQPPNVDGLANDPAWAAARPAAGFALRDRAPAKNRTTVKAVYSDTALYLLFNCSEPHPDRIVEKEKEPDGHVWLDDSVDIYIYPTGSRDDKKLSYYRFSANPLGVRFDEERTNRLWNADWLAAANVSKDKWTLEIALPFRIFGPNAPERGKTKWLVNFVRHRRVQPEEESSFVPGDPRDTSKYAELRFE